MDYANHRLGYGWGQISPQIKQIHAQVFNGNSDMDEIYPCFQISPEWRIINLSSSNSTFVYPVCY